MQIDVQNKSKNLLGVSDLTLAAPIKSGLIPALDSRSYESRLRLLLKTLNTARISSLEAEPTPLIADAVHRIRALHSFRLAVIEPAPKKLLLAVTFDGGWEQYMRRIWRDLGPLLDVIFCNCEGYLTAHSHSFAEYAGWVRSAQVDTEFFYNASSLTVNDLHYLRERERQHNDRDPLHRSPPDWTEAEVLKQGLPALTALYRLTDMYMPDRDLDDGECLLRAAWHLLGDRALLLSKLGPKAGRTATEQAALSWIAKGNKDARPSPARAASSAREKAAWDGAGKVQGGIIKQYLDVTHGCLLLVGLKDAAAAKALLEELRPAITSADRQDATSGPFVNLGFTFQGLKIAGVPNGTLDQLPFEFREGMAARAGILGDLRYNHPTQWTLPARNWPHLAEATSDRVELSSVHAIVQYACRGTPSLNWQELVGSNSHPLLQVVTDFERALGAKGVRILSVQAMQRFLTKRGEIPLGHFEFVDGLSQPTVDSTPASVYSDQVRLGDLLLGYENSLFDPPLTGRLWVDSTFLVIRKLKQDAEALEKVVGDSGLDPKEVKSKLMGRRVTGENLIDPKQGNDFDYSKDPTGRDCPLQSHVRRANPRTLEGRRPDMRTVPRIIRRGMSYGPLPSNTNGSADRGLVFMAYNSSIAEQFEVIQSWLNGGNSSGQHTYSALRDPIVGVPQGDDPCTFVFNDIKGNEQRLKLTSDRPFVKLEWGVYAFVPSIAALTELQYIAQEAALIEAGKYEEDRKKKEDQREIRRAVEAQKGAVVIARLNRVEQALGFEAAKEQWKIALEDVSARISGVSQSIWTAVRQLHGGALRTPYGVLVCSKKLVMQVFDNDGGVYTATGYADRMRKSFGEIYLGMDDEGPQSQYHLQADAANAAIQSISTEEGFMSAFAETEASVKSLVDLGEEIPVDVKDIVDDVLARLSKGWFGLPDDTFVAPGGWHWRPDDAPPTCPGHFHSPSRYMFQPNPGEQATDTGRKHGNALNDAVKSFVVANRNNPPEARLGRALFDAIPNDEQLTRTLIGVMMGFLPTVDGNVRGTLFEWISDRSLWDHQIAYLVDGGPENPWEWAWASLLPHLQRTLQLRPVPELVWRIALKRHKLGSVDVNPGDKIAVSIVSASQECLINDDLDLFPIFGGNRDDDTHPTHACPGYKMAIGVMLGMLAGLIAHANLRPTMSPMALRLSRRLQRVPQPGRLSQVPLHTHALERGGREIKTSDCDLA